MEEFKLKREGIIKIMNCGEVAEIIEYINANNIIVKFKKTGEVLKTDFKTFTKGNVKSHFTPSVKGIGIVGLEKTRYDNGEIIPSYQTWVHMLGRTTDKYKEKHPTYKNCSVCDEWKYYSNFKKWYEDNYYKVNDETMCLDKDILCKGNKIYSPENCIFVPSRINILFTKRNMNRGNLPIGVSKNNHRGKPYIASMSNMDNKKSYLGKYDTIEEAFETYKINKENYIKEVADLYKGKIPNKLYEAMYKYTVNIND